MSNLVPVKQLEMADPVVNVLLSQCQARGFSLVAGVNFEDSFVVAKKKGEPEPKRLPFRVMEHRGVVEFLGCSFKFNTGG